MKLDNNLRATVLVCAATFGASALLVACGGGSTTASVAPAVPTPATLSGTVAGGAAYPTGTVLTFTDKTGAQVATYTLKDGDNGAYSVSIPVTAQAPLIVKASGTDVDTLYSFCPLIVTGNVNVTPITNLITARMSSTGNPADIKPADITPAAAETKTNEVLAVLAPISTALGVTGNPMTAALVANGKGMDQLLDSVKIKITPTTSTSGSTTTTSSNVDVTVVTAQANGSAPIIIPTFSGNASTIPPLSSGGAAVTSIPTTAVVVSGTAAKVTDLVTRMQACFAVPFADRVTTGGSASADIKATACKTLFSGDNPANYKNNGFDISKTGNFSNIFNSGATGAKFDLGKFEFLRANGDVVFSWRGLSPDGANVTYSRAVAKLEGSDLKIIGNQYNYDADVGPLLHTRNFINDATYNYKSTGYRVYVENKQVNGSAAFNRVEVTAPNASKFLLKPTAGYSYLVLVNSNNSLTNAGAVMLNLLPTTTGGADKATIIAKTPTDYYWADTSVWTDAAISAIPQIAQWKFDYFNAGNTGSTADATEYRSTTERAPTLAELAPRLFASYTADTIAQAQKSTATSGGFTFTAPASPSDQMLVDFSADGNKDAWVVPSGVQAPTELVAFGRAPYLSNGATPPVNVSNRFNDSSGIFSAVNRKAMISCSKQSTDDKHCDASVAIGASGKFAVGTFVSYFSLQTYGPSNVRSTSGLATYKPSLNP
jgi:hypothetical protein